MPNVPKLQSIQVADGQTYLTTSLFNQFQTNVALYGAQFMPLVGGVLLGPVTWSSGQTFPSKGVQVTNPPYGHQGFWSTLADHIADGTVHRVPGQPLSHAASHEIRGSDMLTGDLIQISVTPNSGSIKSYIDTSIVHATAGISNSYTPSRQYTIGGADPLYGSTLGIAPTASSTSILTYINAQIALAIEGGYPTTPTFTNVTLSASASYLTFSGGPALISSQGNILLVNDVNNLYLKSPSVGGNISLGNTATPNLFGSFSNAGYTIGSTVIGPAAGVINGPLTVNATIAVNNSVNSKPAAGTIQWGGATGGVLSYNADVVGSFYLNNAIQINGNVTLTSSSNYTIAGVFNTGSLNTTASYPGIRSDNTNVTLNARNGGYINIGGDMSSLSTINLGPTATWASVSAGGIQIGSSVYGASAATVNGLVSVNNGYTATAGDVGTARTNSSGIYYFGRGSTAASIDYGVTTSGYLTFATNTGGTISQIKTDGTYLVGTSSYGPLGASATGTIKAAQAIYAGTGVGFSGAGGYVFVGDTAGSTGMFSTTPGDLRLYTSGAQALGFTNGGNLATFLNDLTMPGILSCGFVTATGSSIMGSLTINNTLYGGGTNITKFRVKTHLDLGYTQGASSSATSTYPNKVMINYTGGQIEVLRLACNSPDTTGTATTFNIKKNGTTIGTVAFTMGSYTAQAFPIVNPTSIVAGDQLQAFCTQVGTASGVTIIVEASQFVY